MKQRLDQAMVARGLVATRSQAESFIKLGEVKVNGQVVTKAGWAVNESDEIELTANEQYVSRAGLKLASVAKMLNLNFKDKVVLDVGSSTGGFTDYALQHGAKKVIAVEVGKDQLHHSLHGDPRIELHEKTDIRNFKTDESIDIVVADVSFISLREILPSVSKLANKNTELVMMVKPQFEAGQSSLKHKGVIKNDKMRREILKDFETWSHQKFVILDKADSDVAGAKGNRERFYLLRKA
jgi:23S rRNA (cytidine1920-2'-O)/16S rRNA (cytidine1409-2'-O)-methyltransferase